MDQFKIEVVLSIIAILISLGHVISDNIQKRIEKKENLWRFYLDKKIGIYNTIYSNIREITNLVKPNTNNFFQHLSSTKEVLLVLRDLFEKNKLYFSNKLMELYYELKLYFRILESKIPVVLIDREKDTDLRKIIEIFDEMASLIEQEVSKK